MSYTEARQSCSGDAQRRILSKAIATIDEKIQEIDRDVVERVEVRPAMLAEKMGEPVYLLYNHNIQAKMAAHLTFIDWKVNRYLVVHVDEYPEGSIFDE